MVGAVFVFWRRKDLTQRTAEAQRTQRRWRRRVVVALDRKSLPFIPKGAKGGAPLRFFRFVALERVHRQECPSRLRASRANKLPHSKMQAKGLVAVEFQTTRQISPNSGTIRGLLCAL